MARFKDDETYVLTKVGYRTTVILTPEQLRTLLEMANPGVNFEDRWEQGYGNTLVPADNLDISFIPLSGAEINKRIKLGETLRAERERLAGENLAQAAE